MGLTIHYQLSCNTRTIRQIRQLISALRQRAMDLPLQEVGEIIELTGSDCDFQLRSEDDPIRWTLVQATEDVCRGNLYHSVSPVRFIGFTTQPGDGCEQANFGMCQYPSRLEVAGKTIRTKLSGWRWHSFCKTQYASNPACGGVENFLRCHTAIVALLDHAKGLGMLADVKDESGYFQNRNMEALAKEVGEWNQGLAAFAGQLKDQLGSSVQAAISEFPDFEHLEAKGQDHLPGQN
jgi:hypothetical protein